MKTVSALTMTLALMVAVGCLPVREYPVQVRPGDLAARAAESALPRWYLPLGPALIEEMHLIGKEKILVGLRHYDRALSALESILVDRRRGRILWRFDRRGYPGDFSLLGQTEGTLVFKVRGGKKTSLLALAEKNGALLWQRLFSNGPVRFLFLPPAGHIVAMEAWKKSVRLRGFHFQTGKETWQREAPGAPGPGLCFRTVVSGQDLFLPGHGMARVSAATGKTLWHRKDVGTGSSHAPPVLKGDRLFLIGAQNRLIQLHAGTGRTLAAHGLPPRIDYTNIYPKQARVYLRGARVIGEKGLGLPGFCLVAMDRHSGQRLWSATTRQPLLSNIVEDGDRVFAGTAKALVGLDRRSGMVIFATPMTNLGDYYPVQVRKVADKVVYISELVVGACDPATGRKLYRRGITPIAYLHNLEASLRNKAKPAKKPKSMFRWADYHNSQTAMHQQAAERLYRKMDPSRTDSLQYRHHRQMERFHSLQAVTASMEELGDAFKEMWQTMAIEAEMRYERLNQRAILTSYVGLSEGKVVYRPHTISGFVHLRAIDLATGAQRDLPLSPAYQTFGIWNVVDADQGVVYHHGIGLDPSRYEFSEPCLNLKMVNAKWYKSYLIAVPM